MAINPSIPLMAQGIDSMKMLENGSQLAQLWQQQKTDGELSRIHRESQGDLSKMMELGKQSKLSRFVMPHLQSQQAAQNKALQDQMQAEANIAKTSSEAFKNNQQGTGYGVDNSQKRLGAINGAILQGAQTGDKTQIMLGLDGLRRTGMLDQATYENYSAKLNLMTPDDIKQWASGVALSGAKDPAALFYTTADNRLDNDTADRNNIRTTQASMYSTDVGAETANKNRAQQDSQFQQSNAIAQQNSALAQQKQFFEQNKPVGFQTGSDGYHYAVYANGKGIRVLGEDGQPIKMQPKGGETPAQKMDRQAKVENFVSAASSASDAAKLATDLANDSKGLNKTAGGYGIMARIPGTDARNFATKIETLQSQVFLNQVEKMRGLGALTDFEGKKLETSIASLDINLEPKQLQQNLTEIAKIMKAAEQKAIKMQQIYSGDGGSGGQKQQSEVLNFFE